MMILLRAPSCLLLVGSLLRWFLRDVRPYLYARRCRLPHLYCTGSFLPHTFCCRRSCAFIAFSHYRATSLRARTRSIYLLAPAPLCHQLGFTRTTYVLLPYLTYHSPRTATCAHLPCHHTSVLRTALFTTACARALLPHYRARARAQ